MQLRSHEYGTRDRLPAHGPTRANSRASLYASKGAYGDIRYNYEQLIDGDNTDLVVQEITSTWPSEVWQLRDYLLDLSPYLSTMALKDLVDKPEVPVAIKTEICVANPEATQREDFIHWAQEEAANPLPAYAIASIVASWDERSYRSVLEAQMAAAHETMTQAAKHIVLSLRTDTVPDTPDTLLWAWRLLPTVSARYAEAGLLISAGELDEAGDLVEAIDTEGMNVYDVDQREHMITVIDVLQGAAAVGRDMRALNSGEVAALQALVDAHYDIPTRWASNLLCALYGSCRPAYTGGEYEERSAIQANGQDERDLTEPLLLVQPNPANQWAAITYKLDGSDGQAGFVVRDGLGRVISRFAGTSSEGQVVWDTREIAAGAYAIELIGSQGPVAKQRVIVQR